MHIYQHQRIKYIIPNATIIYKIDCNNILFKQYPIFFLEAISNINKYSLEYKDKYKKFNDKYNYLDDGNASERVISSIFKK